ncbi:MAG: hypothetical protein ACR2J8_14940 [Thermomicrobiales bacterium]
MPALLIAGAVWALMMAGLTLLASQHGLPWWIGLPFAGWLLLVPGLAGLYFGRWWWLVPVAAGLTVLGLIAPSGLDSRLGNLTIPAIIVAAVPAVVLTGFGAALRPRPAKADADGSAASLPVPGSEMPQGE